MPPPSSHMSTMSSSSMPSTMNQNMFTMQTDSFYPGYQSMSDQAPLPQAGVDTFFSVSQMVSHKSSSPQFVMASNSTTKKASKRSAPSSSLSSNLTGGSSSGGARYQKQTRTDNKSETVPSGSSKKDTERKSSKSQSRY